MQNKSVKISLISIIIILSLVMPTGILATPSSDRAQIRLLKNQVDSIDQQIESIDEDYLQAKIKLKKIDNKYAANSRLLSQTQAKLTSSRKVLSKRVKALYMQGDDYSIAFVLLTKSFNELITNLNFMERVSNSDSLLVKKVFHLKIKLEKAKSNIKSNLIYQKKLVKTIANKKRSIEAEIKRKQRLIGNLQADLNAYEATQERQQLNIARQIAPSVSVPPPTNSPRSQVIEIAKRYLGVPYVWGGASPSGFDCSGFTMYVYAQVGVSLPHSSRAQFGVGQAVPQSALQPGDLVFRGSPIHHVGIYVGGGMMINSPRTGDVVKISPAFTGAYAGARRP